jgi:hypothetical protein
MFGSYQPIKVALFENNNKNTSIITVEESIFWAERRKVHIRIPSGETLGDSLRT